MANRSYPRGFTLIFWLWVAFLTFPNRLSLIVRVVGKRRIEAAFRDFADSLPQATKPGDHELDQWRYRVFGGVKGK